MTTSSDSAPLRPTRWFAARLLRDAKGLLRRGRTTSNLRTLGTLWILVAFVAGLLATGLWLQSRKAWQDHLNSSHLSGTLLYNALTQGAPMPAGITRAPLTGDIARLADSGAFSKIPGTPQPAYVTNVSIRSASADALSGEVLTLAVVSGDLAYRVADLSIDENAQAAEKLGDLTRLLATFCSEPLIYARLNNGDWHVIDGRSIWGCAAAPRDLRLLAILIAVIVLGVLYTSIGNTASSFRDFAEALRRRLHLGGPEAYSTDGPDELRQTVAAINAYLESEREQLSDRAMVLSGVSHDLGTPATRLRLRASLIDNEELREKLDADIDRMTAMIDGVLTYTQSELSAEVPRQISLTSLIESIVADYQDTGHPVQLASARSTTVETGQSIFGSNPRQFSVPDTRRILITARPILLQRAVGNLIDNALKYGRRAEISVKATSERAMISIEDEGTKHGNVDLSEMVAPFHRGANAKFVNGIGLGLTIASRIARQHGGSLKFEYGHKGLRAILDILRS